jgi:hypothetical protein
MADLEISDCYHFEYLKQISYLVYSCPTKVPSLFYATYDCLGDNHASIENKRIISLANIRRRALTHAEHLHVIPNLVHVVQVEISIAALSQVLLHVILFTINNTRRSVAIDVEASRNVVKVDIM